MNAAEFENAISQLIDGTFPEPGIKALQTVLDTDLDALEVYLQTIRLHEALGEIHTAKASPGSFPETLAFEGTGKGNKWPFLFKHSLSIAAGIALLLAIIPLLPFSTKETADTGFGFLPSDNSRYTITNHDHGASEISIGSKISVESGYTKIRFPSGVVAGFSAPAEAVVSGSNSIRLRKGRGYFSVPRKASGFEVLTDELRVIDHGTEFSVLASPMGLDEAQLFKGEIEVRNLSGGNEPVVLKGSGIVRKNSDGDFVVFRKPLDAFKAPAFTDLRLDDSYGNLTTQTSPALLFSNMHDDADGSWGFAWKGGRADCAQVLENGEAWVTRMDLGEHTPMLTTMISGLEPFEKYECSVLLPLRSGSKQGAVAVSFEKESPEWLLVDNSNSSPTVGPSFRGYYEARFMLGVQQADSNGEIRINFRQAPSSAGRSYISAVGIRPDKI